MKIDAQCQWCSVHTSCVADRLIWDQLTDTDSLPLFGRESDKPRSPTQGRLRTPGGVLEVAMWLINTRTLALEEFLHGQIPSYNILSHTWDKGEVTFQDMQSGTASSKAAYHKIIKSCQLSLERQEGQRVCEWVWIDSCCIDKSSSAQLSEAINSELNRGGLVYSC